MLVSAVVDIHVWDDVHVDQIFEMIFLAEAQQMDPSRWENIATKKI